MNAKELLHFATENNACQDAQEWLADLPPETTWDEMREAVPDADWVFWVALYSDDAELLARLAKTDSDTCVRFAATSRLVDQSTLARIATTDSDSFVRIAATSRLDDQDLLARLATDDNAWVRAAATARISECRVQETGK